MAPPDFFSSPEFERNPYPFYRKMRDEHPLYFHEVTRSYMLSRYEDVKRALKDPHFTCRNYEWQLEPVHGRSLVQMDGREHSLRRQALSPAVRGRDLQEKFLPIIERNARELIDTFRDRGEVDLAESFSKFFPIHVIVDMLGLPRAERHRFRAWYGAAVAYMSNFKQDPAVTEGGLLTHREMTEYMRPIIAQRRAAPGADLLSTLCTAEIDGVHMADEEVQAFVSLLLTAAGESTERAITSLFKNLMENPAQLEAVRRDRSLIARAFTETLRYSPPAQMLMRTTDSEVQVTGGTIPANSIVTCLIGSANHDERHFKAPERFDLFREDLDMTQAFSGGANHLGFGQGRHFCVGSLLAKVEVEVATNQLLDAMEELQFAEGQPPPDEGTFMRAPAHLRIHFTPRAAA